jgi:hypothetical protein
MHVLPSYDLRLARPISFMAEINYGRGGNNYRRTVEIIMGTVVIITAARWK